MSSSDCARDRPDESAACSSSPSVAHQLAALIGLAHDESDSSPHPAVERAARGLHIDAELAHDPAQGDALLGMLRFNYGRGLRQRWRGLKQMIGGFRRLGKNRKP